MLTERYWSRVTETNAYAYLQHTSWPQGRIALAQGHMFKAAPLTAHHPLSTALVNWIGVSYWKAWRGT